MKQSLIDLGTFADNVKYAVPANTASAMEMQTALVRDIFASLIAEVETLRALVTPAAQPAAEGQ